MASLVMTGAGDNSATTVDLDNATTFPNSQTWYKPTDNITGNITTNDAVRRTAGSFTISAPSNIMWNSATTGFLTNNGLVKKSLTFNGTAIGTPGGTSGTDSTCVYTNTNTDTFTLTFPVDGSGVTTVNIYCGAFLSGTFTCKAHVSDASSSDVTQSATGGDNPNNFVITCQANGSATLTITLTNGNTGYMYLSGAALSTSVASGGAAQVPFQRDQYVALASWTQGDFAQQKQTRLVFNNPPSTTIPKTNPAHVFSAVLSWDPPPPMPPQRMPNAVPQAQFPPGMGLTSMATSRLAAIVDAWTPPPPMPPAAMPSAIPRPMLPPSVGIVGGAYSKLLSIVASWAPPDPLPQQLADSAIPQPQAPPGAGLLQATIGRLATLLDAWPKPSDWTWPLQADPPIVQPGAAAPVQQPPFSIVEILDRLIGSWAAPDPQPQVAADIGAVPQQQAPPQQQTFATASRMAQISEAWRDPDPRPITAMPSAVPRPMMPPSTGGMQGIIGSLASLLGAWTPPDPQPPTLPPSAIRQAQFPPGMGLAQNAIGRLATFLQSWAPPDPQPQASTPSAPPRPMSPPGFNVGQGNVSRMATIADSWDTSAVPMPPILGRSAIKQPQSPPPHNIAGMVGRLVESWLPDPNAPPPQVPKINFTALALVRVAKSYEALNRIIGSWPIPSDWQEPIQKALRSFVVFFVPIPTPPRSPLQTAISGDVVQLAIFASANELTINADPGQLYIKGDQ